MVTPLGSPLTQIDVFNEAISIVPVVHTPVPAARALIIGAAATSAGWVAMRYPQFTDITVVADSLPPSMQQAPGRPGPGRVHLEPSFDLIATGWLADMTVVAAAQLDVPFIQQVAGFCAQSALVCFAVPVPGTARGVRDMLQQYWPVVTPYRVFLPAPDGQAAYFMLCSAAKLCRFRPVPGYTRYLSEGFMPTLFTWSKDELAMLFGAVS
jgi:hypothetical protein